MITLEKVLRELNAQSLNEIVAGHGGSHKTKTTKTTRKTKKTNTNKKKYY
ncbi:MAG: hypothetical protein INR73_09385 [Williamsia sp.]|nr:hypothetical protein [Williamsia sp.]